MGLFFMIATGKKIDLVFKSNNEVCTYYNFLDTRTNH